MLLIENSQKNITFFWKTPDWTPACRLYRGLKTNFSIQVLKHCDLYSVEMISETLVETKKKTVICNPRFLPWCFMPDGWSWSTCRCPVNQSAAPCRGSGRRCQRRWSRGRTGRLTRGLQRRGGRSLLLPPRWHRRSDRTRRLLHLWTDD